MSAPGDHAFLARPHRTLVALSLPVLVSLVAEPLTGLADTAFVARLGAPSLAALGVGSIALSSVFWIFNFLGVATQTEVARADGAGETGRAAEVTTLALALAFAFGLAVAVPLGVFAPEVCGMLGAEGEVRDIAALYVRVRLAAAPAVIATTAVFGALRGLQDMRTPLVIAVSVNVLNVVLDALWITGVGPFPAWGVAGAAAASAVSQVAGVAWAVLEVRARLGLPVPVRAADARRLLTVGGDLFLRTGLLTAFLLLCTRTATRISDDAGAAHQAIRQVWLLTALVLDAFAAAAQSLIGFFLGAARVAVARRVAAVACAWSGGTGVVLTAAMLAATDAVEAAFVPEGASAAFRGAWWIAAAFQPLNALSFATDGIHWGASDYRFLRNAMLASTGTGVAGLVLFEPSELSGVWFVTGAWIAVRAAFGVARVWPGIGRAPLVPRAT